MAEEHDDGPSDPAKVSTTITAALAAGIVKFPDAAAELRFRAKLDELSETVKRSNGAIDAFFSEQRATHIDTEAEAVVRANALNCPACGGSGHKDDVAPAVTHSNRPEVEVLIAGRHDLMVEVDRWTKLLADREIAAPDCDEVSQLLDRLGAYIVGQDERLVATGEALSQVMTELDEALAERKAAVEDRDKADAARGCAERDHRSVVEGLKGDVRSAEKGFDEEREKRERAEEQLKRESARCAALEMRIEGAIFALRHGMNEHRDGMDIRFSPSTTLIDYLAAPMGDKPRFRVVTSPRFYDEAATQSAIMALWGRFATSLSHGERPSREYYEEAVSAVAAALGMRRAAS